MSHFYVPNWLESPVAKRDRGQEYRTRSGAIRYRVRVRVRREDILAPRKYATLDEAQKRRDELLRVRREAARQGQEPVVTKRAQENLTITPKF